MHFTSIAITAILAFTSSVASTPALPAGIEKAYSPAGCYSDDPEKRVLTGFASVDNAYMDPVKCIFDCGILHFKYAGIEFGEQCFCGNTLGANAVPAPVGECNTPCKGSKIPLAPYCGGGNRIYIFKNGTASA